MISGLEDLQPGDIMFGPIGGVVGFGVGLGQLALGEGFRVGPLSVRHVGIVVEGTRHLPAGSTYRGQVYNTGVITAPRLVQAMPGGAEEIAMRYDTHWTPRHAYARLREDYEGQGEDAAMFARAMVSEGVGYSYASYLALAAWRFGIPTPKLEAWIGRRRRDGLPVEAICSVLVDQAWTLTEKRLMTGVPHQCVTPGALAASLLSDSSVEWGWPRKTT